MKDDDPTYDCIERVDVILTLVVVEAIAGRRGETMEREKVGNEKIGGDDTM